MASIAIAVDSPLTAQAGRRVALQGGNAVDVAVACALAATVTETLMCSLGGAGFFTVRMPGKPAEVIDGGDMIPASREFAADNPDAWRKVSLHYGDGVDTMVGAASIAVPGLLAAAGTAWSRHGSLPWKDVVAPALELASSRIPVSRTTWNWLCVCAEPIHGVDSISRSVFLKDGHVIPEDHLLEIPDLANTFDAISREGADTLYRGSLAEIFAQAVSEKGGLISLNDLNEYRAEVRKPVRIRSGGFEIALNAPPAAGGASTAFLIRYMDVAGAAVKGGDVDESRSKANLFARSQLELLRWRESRQAGDGFDDATARELLELAELKGSSRSPDTTHLSIASADGGLVSATMSMGYGSGIILDGLGICSNNSLGEPEINPYGYHRGEPGSRISSNMAPAVAWHPEDGRRFAIGSPGASRIPTAVSQTWNRIVSDGCSYSDAVASPRLHVEKKTNGEVVVFHEPGVEPQLDSPPVESFEELSRYFGGVKLAGINSRGELEAVADARREGAVEIV